MKRLAILLVLSACRRAAPAPSATAEASAAPPPAPVTEASSAPLSAPASPSTSAAPAPDSGCDLRWGFHGTVAGQETFLRLERTGDAIKGRYFYAKFGIDIPLEGTLDPANHIELTEGDPQKPSGRFTGSCDLATGVLEGSWTGGKPGSKTFRFERVVPRATPLVAKKKLSVTAKAKTLGPGNLKECRNTQELVEIFGAGTPEAEDRINKHVAAGSAPCAPSEMEECETGGSCQYSEGVIGTFRGLVTIVRGGQSYIDGAAHPENFIGFDLTTFDLATGSRVTDSDLWVTVPEGLVKRCNAAFFGEPDGGDADEFLVSMWPDGRRFDLNERGVHIFNVGFPHFAGAYTGQGPTLTWGALLREGALRADSPVKRAWQGIAKAKPGDAECLDEAGKTLR
jgi:hypothetical protein